MNLLNLIENFDGRLTKADRKLITVLFADPAESTYLRAHDLAERAGVHATTAVRLAQKLGFHGYADLRAKIREEIQADNRPADRVRKRLDKMTEGSILHSLVESEIEALHSILDHISQEQMEQAAEALRDSSRVLAYGRSHSASLADLMVRRLNRSGYTARSFHHIDWETAETIMALGRGDVFIAFAFRRVPDRLEALLTYTARVGATSILISDLIGHFLRPRPDILLAASRGWEGESQSLTVPMAICNALILELSKRDGGRSMGSLTRLADVKTEFEVLTRRKQGTNQDRSVNRGRSTDRQKTKEK